MFIDADNLFCDRVIVAVPHMDDCVLACGGSLAQVSRKERIHFVYATDGARSPAPPSRRHEAPTDLSEIRESEAREALGFLGIPQDNIHFLGFPDGGLLSQGREVQQTLTALFARLRPERVLAPFRFDRHPDHIVLNRATIAALSGTNTELLEYFIYYRWRLLPGGDIRRYIRPDQLIGVRIDKAAERKRKALGFFRSQTTLFYSWQQRPILTSHLLEDFCKGPEWFLRSDTAFPGAAVFERLRMWIRFAHYCEPVLKRTKDELASLPIFRTLQDERKQI